MAEVRNGWEGQVINGIFPLRRFLGASDHSSVFLTESAVDGFLNAAIKIVPADPQHSAVQLWQWKTAATFAHPHLIRLLDCGQCELDGRELLFVVMEYAEESLSQILPYRALGPDEVRELLVPTLDALAFLHSENWVQGQLKPANFLVVNDQLKLATDTLRPIAISRVGLERPSMYDPPESDRGEVSAAGDVWALGVTLVEALTQYPPAWHDGRRGPPTFPTNLPPVFAATVQRCLEQNAAERPTIAELQTQTKPVAGAPQITPTAVARPAPLMPETASEPSMQADSRQFSPPGEERKRGLLVPAVLALLIIGAVVWGGSRLFRDGALPEHNATAVVTQPTDVSAGAQPHTPESSAPSLNQLQPSRDRAGDQRASAPGAAPASRSAARTAAAAADATPVEPPARARVVPHPAQRSVPADSSIPASKVSAAARGQSFAGSGSVVVHEEIPAVSPGSRSTIHGHVRVGVRVTVDSSGRVVSDSLDNPGPSKYFNRVASQAARKWRFVATDNRGARQWLLRFEFGRDGTTVHAVGPRS